MIALSISTMSIAQWAILIIVVAGIVAIVVAILRQMNVTIPAFIVTILWIILAVVIGVVAIKFLTTIM